MSQPLVSTPLEVTVDSTAEPSPALQTGLRSSVTLTETIEAWVQDAERMHGGAALGVVVTTELFTHLAQEQGSSTPLAAGLGILTTATDVPADSGLPPLHEMVEIAGPDRVCVYVGVVPQASAFPLGLDPAMPVVFVPVPPGTLDGWAQLEMYNRLRWYGLGPDEALAGSSSTL